MTPRHKLTQLAGLRHRYLEHMNTAKELDKEIYDLNREINSSDTELKCWCCDKKLNGKSYVTMLDGSVLCDWCAPVKRKQP